MIETPEEKRKRLLDLAKEAVAKAYSTGEHSVAQAVDAYNEIEKTRNLLHERIEEWYGIYFPELSMQSAEKYTRFVLEAGGNKKNASRETLRSIFGDGGEEVLMKIRQSIGAEPDANEYRALSALASAETELVKQEKELDAYMRDSVPKLMPNVSYLADYKLAAELLSRAGSLAKLANMPASTLQLLGAEKALFRHLRTGAKPPKYGVLFKLKEVAAADKRSKGRVARLFATKLSVAARADAFSKRFIGKQLRESIDRNLAKIREKESRPHGPERGTRPRMPRAGRQKLSQHGGRG